MVVDRQIFMYVPDSSLPDEARRLFDGCDGDDV